MLSKVIYSSLMKSSENIQNILRCVEALVGDNQSYLNKLTQYIEISDNSTTMQKYTLLEQSTLSIFCILITWLHFESSNRAIRNDEIYNTYSLTQICNNNTKESSDKHNLWHTIYSIYKQNQVTRVIPLFSIDYISHYIHRLLEHYTLPNEELSQIVLHIEATLQQYGISDYIDIAMIYEILCKYSLHRGKEYTWVQSQLYKKYTGSYYTPQEIAKELASYAQTEILPHFSSELWSIIDISCGTGSMLLAMLEHLCIYVHLPSDNIDTYIEKFSSVESSHPHLQYHKEYVKRYCIETMLYGVDINPIALGICSYCLQYTSFIPGIECITIRNLRCRNALFSISYQQVISALDEEMRTECTKLYMKYKKSIHNKNTNTTQILYLKLHELYTHALCCEVARKSTYTPTELYTIYEKQSIYYELEFPEVFEKTSGFTLSIGNPPWEKTKFEETLFIEQFHKGYTKQREEHKRTIRDTTHKTYGTYSSYIKDTLEKEIACYKAWYPMSKGIGDDNIYRYFLELQLTPHHGRILCPGGYLLYIIPTGFITEESSRTLRTYILEHTTIHHITSFENRNVVFPFIDSRYKFSIILLEHKAPTQETIEISSMNTFTKGLHEYEHFPIKYKDIIFFSQGSYAIPEFRNAHDSRLLASIYALFPRLSEEYISIRRELDCASNRELFHSEYSDYANIPLYQGAMIWQYNSQYATAKQYVSSHALDTILQSRELYRLYNDIYQCLPQDYKKEHRYLGKADAVSLFTGISRAEMILECIPEYTLPRFALRAIARNTDERSVICSLLPYNVTYQNSLFGSIAKRYTLTESNSIQCIPTPLHRQLYSISIFNSLVYDWCMRFISAINISKAYIHRLPFPQPHDNLLTKEPYCKLIQNTCSLQLLHDTRIREIPLPESPQIHTEEEAEALQIENDCLVAQLYNLRKRDLEHISSQQYFAVLHKKKKRYREQLLDSYSY